MAKKGLLAYGKDEDEKKEPPKGEGGDVGEMYLIHLMEKVFDGGCYSGDETHIERQRKRLKALKDLMKALKD